MIISYNSFGESWVLFSYFITPLYKEPCKIRVYVTHTHTHTLSFLFIFCDTKS